MNNSKETDLGEQLLAFLEDKVANDFNPLDRQEILDFTQQYGIDLREDHLEFLIKYGDAPLFSRGYQKGVSFEGFKDYYIEEKNDLQKKRDNSIYMTPPGILYFGYEDMEPLTIKQETGELGDYPAEYANGTYYLNIKSFLFYNLFRISEIFDEKSQGHFSSIEEAELYRKEHEKDRLINIGIYMSHDNSIYYYHDHMIMFLDKSPSTFYKKYVGGVLNQFEEK